MAHEYYLLDSLSGIFTCNTYSTTQWAWPKRMQNGTLIQVQVIEDLFVIMVNRRILLAAHSPNFKTQKFYLTVGLWPDTKVKIVHMQKCPHLSIMEITDKMVAPNVMDDLPKPHGSEDEDKLKEKIKEEQARNDKLLHEINTIQDEAEKILKENNELRSQL